MESAKQVTTLAQHGFAISGEVLSAEQCNEWINYLGPVAGVGRRSLLLDPKVRTLANSPRILNLVRPHLRQDPISVRGIYFDKSPGTNWLVAWHQDLTLAVRERHEVPGFGPWSIKDGVPHVQPPSGLLEQMLTVRIHLDPCDARNGALGVIPGSHTLGRLDPGQIEALCAEREEVLCEAGAGDVLLMRPLLLHASAKSQTSAHRRVMHLEYAGFDLPSPLKWAEA